MPLFIILQQFSVIKSFLWNKYEINRERHVIILGTNDYTHFFRKNINDIWKHIYEKDFLFKHKIV